MRLSRQRQFNMKKAFYYTVVINGMQIAAALFVAVLSLLSGGKAFIGMSEQMLLMGMALIVVWGAAMDISEARRAWKVGEEADMLESAYEQLETLNNTMRAQRHDFINHLQVVSSLIELNESAEALDYIERVHTDIRKVGRTLKTAHPAINALLAAKLSDCENRRVTMTLNIQSLWRDLPVPSWEMCRVLGNLIDNAIDALKDTASARIAVEMDEDPLQFTFSVANNGPQIEESVAGRIFQMGFSTKNTGRGMGLAIVSDILKTYGGRVTFSSAPEETVFRGQIPKKEAVSRSGE